MRSPWFSHSAKGVLFCLMATLAVPVYAQSPSAAQAALSSASQAVYQADPAYAASALTGRYPPKSIDSVERADQALEAVKKGRKQADDIFKRQERACYKKFFANRCISE